MQAEELSYVIVTWHSMRKSRTGGIIARLISRTGLDLDGARMFAPSAQLVRRYADTIVTESEPRHRATQELIRDYVLKNFTGEQSNQQARVLFLVFRGPDAVDKVQRTVGHIVHEQTSGETIRDTFGDYITNAEGKVTYFEPAVLTAFHPDEVERDLKLWAEFSDRDGGILDKVIAFPASAKIEKPLVLIKPDNFKFPNVRPGGVIGGRESWESIVEFMAGMKPSECPPEKREAPGTEKCVAIVYQGVDAVRKIRDVLGPTDPKKAPPGSIRKEFGQTIMINAAHASDSAENAKREMEIVQVHENNLKPLIENFYARQ